MTKYGLRARVLAFTIIPTLLIGTLLAGYFIFHRHQQIENFMIEQGTSVIEPLAIASEYGLTRSSREDLRRLISTSHRRNSPLIKSIAIFTKDNNLFVTSNFHRDFMQMRLPDGHSIPELTSVQHVDDYIILRTPIFAENSLSETSLQTSSTPEIIGYMAIQLNIDRSVIAQYRDTATAIFIVLLGLIMSLFFGLNLVHVVIEPINRMVRAVYHIREGRLDTRVRGKMDGELDMLKNGINAMAKAISEYHNEMQQSIDQATSDLRETLEQIEIQNVELDMAKKRAQEAARIKSEFLANMSHELRTPLNGVIGFTRQLFKTQLSLHQHDYLNTIEHSAKNLLSIINDILDFSKLEAGKLTLENIPFNIREMVNDTVTLLAPSAHDKKLELSLLVNQPLPDLVAGDPLRLQQIVTNIVGNAIKFTEQGMVNLQVSTLRLAEPHKVLLQFRIRDTGIGMDNEQLMRLFQPFIQGDSSISRRYGGTGLGLVISQKLIEQMNGAMQVHSEPNQGSEFTISIPLELVSEEQNIPAEQMTLAGKKVLLSEKALWSREACLSLLHEWQMEVVQTIDEQPQDDGEYYAMVVGFPPDTAIEQIQSTVTRCLQQYRLEKLIVLINSSDPTLHEHLMQNNKIYSLSKPVIHSKLLQSLLQPLPPAQTLTVPVEVQKARLPLRILAVDDNPANLKLIMALLNDLVEEVHSCQDGHQAVSLAEKDRFDIIFMDVQMPLMDGIQASQIIHRNPLNKRTPIIAVTAHASPGERERLMSSGMDEYLSKPIDEIQLKRLLLQFSHLQPVVTLGPKFIDWDLALEKTKGNAKLAEEMLQMLVASFDEIRPLLEASAAGTECAELLDAIHKLRGGAAYCGVPQLQRSCAELEQGLRSGISCSAFEPELLELLDIIDAIKTESAQWLAQAGH
ncbi:two-component sensor histidine kinase BarA [Tolumonas lignilytica]|uniref:two-component sensor histidine kinase BarA n=1 Tax=Tolumonas lignilytica TaxID=1283284 RepID=UPI0004635083|nr:two-component sensor histidine kinase BarA [Tolumonas lignilytica]